MKRSAIFAACLLACAAHADQITQVLPQVQGQAVKPPVAAPAPAPAPAPNPPASAPAPAVKTPAPAPVPPKTHTPAPAPTPPKPVPAPAPITNVNPSATSTAQAQAQAAAQAAAQSRSTSGVKDSGNSASTSAATGGTSAATAAGAAGNTTDVNVNTGGAPGSGSTTTYRSLSVALPPAPDAIAPTMVGGPVAQSADAKCGLAQRVEAVPVYGTQFGIFSNSQVQLGSTEQTQPYLDASGAVAPYILIGSRWYGHQVLYSTAVLGVSGASSLAVGGFGSSGGGNAGGGVSGGMQRLVTTIQLRLCEIGPAVAVAPAAVVISELPLLTKKIAR